MTEEEAEGKIAALETKIEWLEEAVEHLLRLLAVPAHPAIPIISNEALLNFMKGRPCG